MVIGVIILLIGIATLAFIPAMSKTPKDFEEWLDGAEEGDSIQVMGLIDLKGSDTVLGTGIYTYKFQDCSDCTFYGSDRIEDGSLVIINIEIHDGIPQVRSKMQYEICVGIGIPLLVSGVLLIVLGRVREKRCRQMGLAQPPTAMQHHGMPPQHTPPPQY